LVDFSRSKNASAITTLAESRASVTVQEFQLLNRCLDTAIAAAVTEHGRITAQHRTAHETEHLERAAHELRDLLNTSLLAFQALKRGDVAINGSTGAVLGRYTCGGSGHRCPSAYCASPQPDNPSRAEICYVTL